MPGSPVTSDDRAARYMPFMALGGTSVHIPVQLLQIVAVTKVLGQERVLSAGSLSANMLSQAKQLCLDLLGPDRLAKPYTQWVPGRGYLDQTNINTHLLYQNGDAELWLRLCAIANPPPVHILRMGGDQADVGLKVLAVTSAFEGTGGLRFNLQPYDIGGGASSLFDAKLYPSNAPVGNDQGGLDPCLVLPTADGVGNNPACKTSSSTGNLWPWCVDPTWDSNAKAIDPQTIPSELVPYECPPEVIKATQDCGGNSPPDSCFGNEDANRWAVRGAINAGMSVFHYVQSIETSEPPTDYNVCPASNWEPK
jgi:hypothetical protein